MSAISQLPPLRDVIKSFGLDARKSLGQHFLLDLNLTGRIAKSAGDMSGRHIIEIGPGPGGLTRALLDTEATMVVAIERDRRCIEALQPLVEAAQGRFQLIEADALTVDPTTLTPAPRVIVANLPYNVGTPLLIGFLRHAAAYESMTLMFQTEVADRITAAPGSKTYGRLSVISQWLCHTENLLIIPASAFTPPPKVESTVVKLTPKIDSPDTAISFKTMERLTAAAFGQRRKMLRSSLKSVGGETLLEKAAINPTSRAEEIDVAGFCRMARELEKSSELPPS